MLEVSMKTVREIMSMQEDRLRHGEKQLKGHRVFYAETARLLRVMDQLQGIILMILKTKTWCTS